MNCSRGLRGRREPYTPGKSSLDPHRVLRGSRVSIDRRLSQGVVSYCTLVLGTTAPFLNSLVRIRADPLKT